MPKEPSYCLHRATGQAYIRLDGKQVYLGPYDSKQSWDRYDRLKAEWLLNRKSKATRKAVRSKVITVADVCLAFLDHAKQYYRESSEEYHYSVSVRPLEQLYATLDVREFSPLHFRCCRDWWLQDSSRSRQYVNKNMRRIRTVFRWAVGMGFCPPAVYDAIRCVDPLKRGRVDAREAEPVVPVSDDVVEKTLEYCTPVVADMIRLQQLVGCRPGEVCALTPAMVDRSCDVWVIRLHRHKTAYRGKERLIYCGPKAQAILSKYLLRGKDDPCFSPVESEQLRREARHAARKTRMSCGNVPGSNRVRSPQRSPRSSFDTASYANSIRYACRKAKVSSWSPNQLRHNAATKVRKLFGLEGAQIVLGHANASVTQIYAERDLQKGIEIARRIG